MHKAPQSSLKWFREARYGMFIHYGLYSLLERHEWVLCNERMPKKEYMALANRFNPKRLHIAEWVELAKESGMRYMCLTTRHHDGFALFDSQASDFNSMKTAAGRDFVREYTDACRKAGLGVGLYYSVGDWNDEGYVAGPLKDPKGWKRYVNIVHGQLRELMSRYGRIQYLFYDGCPPPKTWHCAQINAEIRRLQPGILISDRCGLDEDVKSAEQHTVGDPGKMWECCMTSNESWGYNYGDSDWKTVRQVVQTLLTCAHNGGNFLFNIGPKADGSVPAPAARILKGVSEWLKKNGDAIYGTTPHPLNYADQCLSTSRGNIAYVPLHYYHGPETVVAGIGNKVKSVRLLAAKRAVAFRQDGNRMFLTGLPEKSPDPIMPVLEFNLGGKPRGIPNPLLGSKKKYKLRKI